MSEKDVKKPYPSLVECLKTEGYNDAESVSKSYLGNTYSGYKIYLEEIKTSALGTVEFQCATSDHYLASEEIISFNAYDIIREITCQPKRLIESAIDNIPDLSKIGNISCWYEIGSYVDHH